MKTERLKWISLLSVCLILFSSVSCQKDDAAVNELQKPSEIAAIPGGQISAVPDPCIQRCLVAGQHTNVGTVDVAVDNGDILITYNITKPGIYLSETHADVFASIEQFKQDKKLSNGGAIPGKFAYKSGFSGKNKVSMYTLRIPKAYVDKYAPNGCLFIATHAALSNGETAWGGICADTPKGVSLENARQFPGNNWSVYFDFCLDECKSGVDFTYAWEDLRNDFNDADYNDLIVQADATRLGNSLKLKFLFPARGAAYDHEFKIKIPKQGITGIAGASSYTLDGSNYIITVVSSTKDVLKPYNDVPHVNTWKGMDCVATGTKEIVLTVDNSFVYNTTRPFEPFITVYSSGQAGEGNSYDLTIYELSGKDTWVAKDGKVYPNGILIPSDWYWPWETQHINGPYPNFPNANWAANLAEPSLTWDRNKCK